MERTRKGTKVKVWLDKEHYLGIGVLVDWVSLKDTGILFEDNFKSYVNFLKHMGIYDENRLEEIKTISRCSWENSKTPKILMEDGKIYYGNQIWWEPV